MWVGIIAVTVTIIIIVAAAIIGWCIAEITWRIGNRK